MKHTRKGKQKNICGNRVREARLRAKPTISQDDLAGRLATHGILLDRTAISRIESQTRFVMDYEIKAIAKCLKIPLASLFES